MEARPKTSPYLSRPVKLTFGPTYTVYRVPHDFIPNKEWLDQCSDYFPLISEDVGHIMVHYLFTGQYQALQKNDKYGKQEASSDLAWEEFYMALQVLIIAEICLLPGLGDLAKIEIRSFDSFFDIYEKMRLVDAVIRESNTISPETIASQEWLKDFLVRSLKSAFLQNNNVFRDATLFDDIHDIKLLKGLASSVIEICYHELENIDLKTRDHSKESQTLETTTSVPDIILTPKSLISDRCEASNYGKRSVAGIIIVSDKDPGGSRDVYQETEVDSVGSHIPAKTDNQSDTHSDNHSDSHSDIQSDTHSDDQSDAYSDNKSDTHSDTHSDNHSDTRLEKIEKINETVIPSDKP